MGDATTEPSPDKLSMLSMVSDNEPPLVAATLIEPDPSTATPAVAIFMDDDNDDDEMMLPGRYTSVPESEEQLRQQQLRDEGELTVIAVLMEEGYHCSPTASERRAGQADGASSELQVRDELQEVQPPQQQQQQRPDQQQAVAVLHGEGDPSSPESTAINLNESQQRELQNHGAQPQSVHFDETTALDQDSAEEHVEEKTADWKRWKSKAFLLLLSLLLLGGAVAATVGSLTVKKNNKSVPMPTASNNNNSINEIDPPPPMDDPTMVSGNNTESNGLHPSTNDTMNCFYDFVLVNEILLLNSSDSDGGAEFLLNRQLQDISGGGCGDVPCAVSRDGSTAVLRDGAIREELATYGLAAEGGGAARFSAGLQVFAAALSDGGDRLALGVAPRDAKLSDSSLHAFEPGGSLLLYERRGDENSSSSSWEYVDEVVVGGGTTGGVFSVAISGDLVAFVAGQEEEIGGEATNRSSNFISVYQNVLSDFDVLRQVGNSLLNSDNDNWINQNSTVRLVENRLFVAGGDEWLRILELNDGIWHPVGSLIPLPSGKFDVSATDPSLVVTVSSNSLSVLEYVSEENQWQALDVSEISEWLSSVYGDSNEEGSRFLSIGPTSVSRSGGELLVGLVSSSHYWVVLFRRLGHDGFSLAGRVANRQEGTLHALQVTNDGDVVLATAKGFAVHARLDCT